MDVYPHLFDISSLWRTALTQTCARFLQSLALPIKLFNSSSPEGHCGGNQPPDGSICHSPLKPKNNDRFALQKLSVILSKRSLWPSTMVSYFVQTSLMNISIFWYMLSWLVKDATTFAMELCRYKQATLCVVELWTHQKFESFKKIRDDENRNRICWWIKEPCCLLLSYPQIFRQSQFCPPDLQDFFCMAPFSLSCVWTLRNSGLCEHLRSRFEVV